MQPQVGMLVEDDAQGVVGDKRIRDDQQLQVGMHFEDDKKMLVGNKSLLDTVLRVDRRMNVVYNILDLLLDSQNGQTDEKHLV